MSLVVWSALIPIIPFFWRHYSRWSGANAQSLVAIDLTTILSLVYLAFVATIVGYGIWGSLLGRYETWRWRRYRCWCRWSGWPVRPYCWMKRLRLQLLGAVLIMAGLYINVFGLRLRKRASVKG
jgi:O-acetylserine/cysteine efflux transporter